MRKRLTFLAIVGPVVLAGLASSAAGSELYAVNAAATGILHRVDQITGATTLIGNTGYTFPGDLTSDTRVGSYRIWSPDLTTGTLLTIDPVTGAGASVGPFSSPTTIVSLAFDITTGKLYGNTATGFGAAAGDQLYEIDPNTGACTLIGTLGVDNVYALAFNNAGTLYGVAHDRHSLVTISTATGAASLVAPVGLDAVYDIATRPEDNVTFAVDTITSKLYTLDLATGATAEIGPYTASNLVGLAFSPVPEPTTLVLLAGGLAFLARRRRHRRA